jgi:hypothetical protein
MQADAIDNEAPSEPETAAQPPREVPRLFPWLAALISAWSAWLVLAFPAALFPGGWYYAFCAADLAFTAAAAAGLVRARPALVTAYIAYKIALAIVVAGIPGAPGTAKDLLLATWALLPAVLVVAGVVVCTEDEEFDVADVMAESPLAGASGDWFTPSTFKFLVMDIVTLGLYKVYWNYRQWKCVKQREGSAIMPFWRAVFTPIWFYFLLRRMAAERSRLGLPAMPAGLLTALYLALVLTYVLPPPLDLLGSVLAVIPMLAANRYAITLNQATGRGAVEGRFSALNAVGLALGGAFWLLTILGLFFAEA